MIDWDWQSRLLTARIGATFHDYADSVTLRPYYRSAYGLGMSKAPIEMR